MAQMSRKKVRKMLGMQCLDQHQDAQMLIVVNVKRGTSNVIENEAGISEGVEIDHIADRAIGDGGTENGDFILVSPVVHGPAFVRNIFESVGLRGWML